MASTNCTLCNPEAGETASGRCVPMVGRKFGKLTVLALVCVAPRHWKCRCVCGSITVVEGGNLRRKVGGIKSCGKCGRASDLPRYADWKRAQREASDARAD